MASLYFRYGAMGSGKSMRLIVDAYNYESHNGKIILIKPSIDTKGDNTVVSRAADFKREVNVMIKESESIFEMLRGYIKPECIFVDEAQFLSEKQVEELWQITHYYDVPVICYGLKTDFQTRLFPGSKRLIELADKIEELPSIDKAYKKARYNARKVNGVFTTEGEQVVIDEESANIALGLDAKAVVSYEAVSKGTYLEEVACIAKVKTFKI